MNPFRQVDAAHREGASNARHPQARQGTAKARECGNGRSSGTGKAHRPLSRQGTRHLERLPERQREVAEDAGRGSGVVARVRTLGRDCQWRIVHCRGKGWQWTQGLRAPQSLPELPRTRRRVHLCKVERGEVQTGFLHLATLKLSPRRLPSCR